ncbi:MAG: hypothetical protein Q4C25_04650, partial [Bacillota bacterium]|nr:hypothetical protein [Bacillota bacterium]
MDGKIAIKKIMLRIALIIGLFVAVFVCIGIFNTVHAEEELENTETIGAEDISDVEQTAPVGSTQFVEKIDAQGKNLVTEPETFENDPEQTASEEDASGDTDTDGTDPGQSGSGGEAGGEQGDGQETVVENAIQKAVDKAWAEAAAGIKELTITVDEGTYNGDISISLDAVPEGMSPEELSNLILYILTKDSFAATNGIIDKTSINSTASGGAVFNGNIMIDGINVVMAGIYCSQNTQITVKDSVTKLYGTVKDDNFNVILENAALFVDAGNGLDTIGISATGENTSNREVTIKGKTANIYIDGGKGSDVYNVDLSAGALGNTGNDGKAVIIVEDQDGGRVHLTGALKDDAVPTVDWKDEDQTAEIDLTNADGKALQIHTQGIEAFTDQMTNKSQVTIKDEDLADGIYNVGTYSFTDFVFNTSQDKVNIKITGSGFLNSLIVKKDDTMTVGTIDGTDINVYLSAKEIIVETSINAANVIIEAYDDDSQISIDVIPDAVPVDKEITASFFDMVSEARVLIREGASINASGSVSLTAATRQPSNMIPLVGGVNVINIKIGNAVIELLGTIEAGGSIKVDASSSVTISASNSILQQFYIPLAVNVSVTEAKVTVGENAKLTAGGDVSLSSNSTVTVTSLSTVGALPISLAVSVVVNDSHVEVLGQVVSENGDISLAAKGTSTVVTRATRTTPITSPTAVNPAQGSSTTTPTGTGSLANQYGGFFAVSVVIQDVDASVKGAGSLTAENGDVTIDSQSTETVNTQAISVGGSEAQNTASSESGEGGIAGIKNKLMGIINDLKESLKGNVTTAKEAANQKLNAVLGNIEGASGNAITIQQNEHGAVTAPARAEVGQTVTVKVTPNTGYKLTGLTYTHLPPGSVSYMTVSIDISRAAYTFEMPAAEITIVATFAKDDSGATTGDDDPGIGSLFEDEEEQSMGLEDLFDEGTSGSQEEQTTPVTPTAIGQFDIENLQKTSLLGTKEGAVISSHIKANAGDNVEVTINPAAEYAFVEGSLKAIYTNTSGKKITYTIPKTSEGKYIFTMPEIKAGTKLTFDATFKSSAGATGGIGSMANKASKAQATGALAVSIVINRNDACIDTDGNVTAGGTLTVNAKADTYANSIANAANFIQPAAGQAPTNPVTGQVETNDGLITGEQKHGIVTISATTNGTVTFESRAELPTEGQNVAVKVTPAEGYKLTAGSLKYTYQTAEGEKTAALLLDNSTKNYYFTIPTGVLEGTQVVISALFEGDTQTITTVRPENLSEGSISAPENANTGQEITVTVTPGTGYKVSEVYYYDTPAAGSTTEANKVVLTADASGAWKFKMPAKNITIKAKFIEKGYAIVLPTNVKVNNGDNRADAGETVTLAPTDASQSLDNVKIEYGYRSMFGVEDDTSIAINYSEEYGEIKFDTVKKSFEVPGTLKDGMIIVVTAGTTTDKAYEVKVEVQKEAGSTSFTDDGIISAPGRVNGGDVMTINVIPNAGYILAPGSLKIEITNAAGTESQLFDVTANAA